MTVSICMHGDLFELSAFPDNSGSVSIDTRDRTTGAVNSVTIFTGSPAAALEIYEALGPIFQRYGGSVRRVVVLQPVAAPPHQLVRSDDGWIEWSGGDCPVADITWVEWKLRSGSIPFGMPAQAGGLRWNHAPEGSDIIAYRVVTGGSDADPVS